MISGHLGNIGILAKPAAKVTAHGGNRIRKSARQKMKQGFFFDGIHMPGNDFTINQRVKFAGLILAHAAFTPSAIFYHATMAAQVAFDPGIF
jgi:hypothetical protein